MSVFLCFYIIQGMSTGLFMDSLPVLLKQSKESWTGLGVLSLSSYTFIFEFLICPLLDRYYIKSIGKRRTYLIPSSFVLSVFYIILIFNINDWLLHKQILSRLLPWSCDEVWLQSLQLAIPDGNCLILCSLVAVVLHSQRAQSKQPWLNWPKSHHQ